MTCSDHVKTSRTQCMLLILMYSSARRKLDESLREMSSHVKTGRERTASSPEEDEDGNHGNKEHEAERPAEKIMRSLPMV